MGKRIALTDGRWFDPSKAKTWDEETRFDGRNRISKATGSQWEHETLYRTTGGTYVLHHWSQWQGGSERYDVISAEDAARWLSCNDYLDGDAEEAGPEVEKAYAALEVL
jgi:hypothetical protein